MSFTLQFQPSWAAVLLLQTVLEFARRGRQGIVCAGTKALIAVRTPILCYRWALARDVASKRS